MPHRDYATAVGSNCVNYLSQFLHLKYNYFPKCSNISRKKTSYHIQFIGVSGRMFLLVPAHPGGPRQRAIKRWWWWWWSLSSSRINDCCIHITSHASTGLDCCNGCYRKCFALCILTSCFVSASCHCHVKADIAFLLLKCLAFIVVLSVYSSHRR